MLPLYEDFNDTLKVPVWNMPTPCFYIQIKPSWRSWKIPVLKAREHSTVYSKKNIEFLQESTGDYTNRKHKMKKRICEVNFTNSLFLLKLLTL